MSYYGRLKKNTYVKECRILNINGWDLKLGAGRITWKKDDGEVVDSLGYSYDGEKITLNYTVTSHNYLGEDEKEDYEYSIPIVHTEPNFGGKRPWFICPAKDCGRRAGKLYLPPNRSIFACRHCHDLSYESQGRSNTRQYEYIDRWEKKCYKILDKLNADYGPGIDGLPYHPEKPKGMHEDTYQELLDRYCLYHDRVLEGFHRGARELLDRFDD